MCSSDLEKPGLFDGRDDEPVNVAAPWKEDGKLSSDEQKKLTLKDPLYIASDSMPATMGDVLTWLQNEMGITASSTDSPRLPQRANKRCRNARMLSTGFELTYPDYQSGYRALLRNHDTM